MTEDATWNKPVPRKLDAETLSTLDNLTAASASLPWSHRRGAEIQHAKQLLVSPDALNHALGGGCLQRLKVQLLDKEGL